MATVTLDQPVTVDIGLAPSPWRNEEHPLPSSLSPASLSAWFDDVYALAEKGDVEAPWDRGEPSPALRAWLNAEAPGLVRPGGRVAVSGCGLGHDVIELINRGYDVCAFDSSPVAIRMAKRLYPDHAGAFSLADLCDPPSRYRHRFDLLVDVNLLQSASPELMGDYMHAMVELLGPHGVLLMICECRGAEAEQDDWPPLAHDCQKLVEAAASAGLKPTRQLDDFEDDATPPRRVLRGAFTRS